MNVLKKVSSTITITTFNLGQDELRTPISPRGLEKLSKKCGFKDIIALNNPIEAFNYAVNSSQDVVLVTGSFYLLNHIRPLILSKK